MKNYLQLVQDSRIKSIFTNKTNQSITQKIAVYFEDNMNQPTAWQMIISIYVDITYADLCRNQRELPFQILNHIDDSTENLESTSLRGKEHREINHLCAWGNKNGEEKKFSKIDELKLLIQTWHSNANCI